MSMTNDISYDDLCNLIANMTPNATPKSVDTYLRGIYETILRQLELNHRINIKGFGCFSIKERKSGVREIHNPNTNEKQLVYVKPKYSISFKASSKFDYSVNENNFKLATDKKIKNESRKKRNKKLKRIENVIDLLNIANKRAKENGDYNG